MKSLNLVPELVGEVLNTIKLLAKTTMLIVTQDAFLRGRSPPHHIHGWWPYRRGHQQLIRNPQMRG
jgi:ABC-type histidine transport system ATPase subunit